MKCIENKKAVMYYSTEEHWYCLILQDNLNNISADDIDLIYMMSRKEVEANYDDSAEKLVEYLMVDKVPYLSDDRGEPFYSDGAYLDNSNLKKNICLDIKCKRRRRIIASI